MAEDGPTDVDVIQGIRIESVRTVQIGSDAFGIDDEERRRERICWTAEAGDCGLAQLVCKRGVSLPALAS